MQNQDTLNFNKLSNMPVDYCRICSKLPYKPRLMACMHTFCENCIETISKPRMHEGEQTIKCPTCNEATMLDDKGAAGLPLNYHVLNIKADLKKSGRCTLCRGDYMAVAICKQCKELLCQVCGATHEILRAYNGHKVLSLSDPAAAAVAGIEENLQAVSCAQHADTEAVSYCCNCKVLACKPCELEKHNTAEHQLDTLTNAAYKAIQNLEMYLKSGEQRKNYYEILISDLTEFLQFGEKINSSNQKRIMSCHAKIVETVNNCSLRALDKLNSFELKCSKTHERKINLVKELQELIDTINTAVDEGNINKYLLHYKRWEMNLERIMEALGNTDNEYEVVLEGNMQNIEQVLQKAFKQYGNPAQIISNVSKMAKNTSALVENTSLLAENTFKTAETTFETAENSFETANNISEIFYNAKKLSVATPISVGVAVETQKSVTLFSAEELIVRGIQVQSDILKNGPMPINLPDNVRSSPGNGKHQKVLTTVLATLRHEISTWDKRIPARPAVPHAIRVHWRSSAHLLPIATYQVPQPMPIVPFLAVSKENGIIPPGCYMQPLSNSKSHCVMVKQLQLVRSMGSCGSRPGQMKLPSGFSIDPCGKIFIADTQNHRVQVFDQQGELLQIFGHKGSRDGELWLPRKVLVLPNKHFIVCDRGGNRSRIQVFLESGAYSHTIPTRFVAIIAGIALTEAGNIIIVDSVMPSISVINELGDLLFSFDCNKRVREPSDLAIKAQNIYVSDYKAHQIAVFDKMGNFKYHFGQSFCWFPAGVEVLHDGRILVVDAHGNYIHLMEFLPNGNLVADWEYVGPKPITRVAGLKLLPDGCMATIDKCNGQILIFEFTA